MVLLYNESEQELEDLGNDALSQRLYRVRGFENDGNRIVLQRHINAQQDKELGKGESVKDFGKLPEKIRQGINGLKLLVLGSDFVFSIDGRVVLKR